ncbi:MAG: FkbM family methyltransferase [Chitinivibrionales bacterium]|nr:FkbM family methyltransferase [Chitinivibrionales bacterium]
MATGSTHEGEGSMPMANTLEKAAKRLMRLKRAQPRIPLRPLPGLVRIGTRYGGSVIPGRLLNGSSVCVLAGAGEDISFDVGIVQRYGCRVYILDPTPRARAHFEELVDRTIKGEPMPINYSRRAAYALDKDKLPKLHFEALGVWTCSATCKFYAPSANTHVSHSLVNVQKTEDYFEARTERLSTILPRYGITRLDLLKLDIAGAEYGVLASLIEDQLDVRALCVEFTESNTPADEHAVARIEQAIERLLRAGYVAVNTDANCNVTFLRSDVYRKLHRQAGRCAHGHPAAPTQTVQPSLAQRVNSRTPARLDCGGLQES